MIKIKRNSFIFTTIFIIMLIVSSLTVFADAPKEGDEVTFQILFTSDIHGSFEDYNYATGLSTPGSLTRAATIIKKEKAAFKGVTLVIDVGDTIQGNGTSMFINNKDYVPFPVVEGFNLIGYDAIVVGNHEFNFGIDALYSAYDGFKGDKLLANVVYENGKYLNGFAPYKIYEVGGIRVAVIGLVTPNIDRWDASNVAKANLKAMDPDKAARAAIDYLEANNLADVYVGAAHMAEVNEFGRSGSGATDVARMNPEFAVIMGAHYHTITGTKDKQFVLDGTKVKFAENKNAAGSVGKILITATYQNGDWVIKNKDGSFQESGVKTDIIPVDKSVEKNAELAAAFEKAHKECIDYVTKTVIGRLEGGPLVPDPEILGTYEGYLKDTALSDLILDVMLYYTNADIAGSAPLDTTANCQPGDITIGGVAKIYKYDNNTLYKIKMTGAQVKRWMEWSYSYFSPTINGVVDHSKPAVNLETDLTIPIEAMAHYNQDQFAGIIYEVDLTKPVGQRIHVVSMANGTAFDLNKEYVVAANNFRSNTQLMATSPKGVFQEGDAVATLLEEDVQTPTGKTSMMDFITEYISIQPNGVITNTCDNNWKFVNLNWDPELRQKAVAYINSGLIQTDFKAPVTKKQVLDLKGVQVPNTGLVSSNGKTVYTVIKGDNLFKIAKQIYGDGNQWKKIYDLNQTAIKDYNLIFIGQEILIP